MSAGLLRAEVRRFRNRRFVLGIVAASLLLFILGVTIAAQQHEKPTAASIAQAQAEQERQLEEFRAFAEQCARDQPAESCPSVEEQERFAVGEAGVPNSFDLRQQLPDGTKGIGALAGALLFLVGATWIGAEWSTRSLMALMFWEPRRIRVLVTKFGVLVGAATALAVLAQVLWFGAAHLLARTRGTTGGLPEDFYADVLATQGRAVLLGVLLSGLGFALAHLFRNTGAALGLTAFYLMIVENLVRGLRPRWGEWLLTTNAGALLDEGRQRLYVGDDDGVGRTIEFGQVHGAVVLSVVVATLLVVGGVLFARRDLT